MSKEFLETCGSETLHLEEEVDSLWSRDVHEGMRMHNEARWSKASISSICADTGQLTSHDSYDLQEKLRQFRLERQHFASKARPKFQRPLIPMTWGTVEVDDELHGREGEWLVVTDITPDQQVVTLQCFQTGKVFTRAARAVQDDVQGNRLKVHRDWPDAPPEFED